MPMMGRHGTGSIVKRKHGPPYHATLIVGGKRLFRYAQTLKEAEKELTELKRMRDNDLDPTRQTVADFLRSWMAELRDAKRQRVRPRTLEHYQLIVERHLIPSLGAHRVSALRERHVQLALDHMEGSARSVHHRRAVLRRALNVAQRRGLVERNPAVGVELPDATYSGAKPLTIEEAQAVLEATVDDRLHALWRLAIDTGLRQSELLGLGWDDIDLDAGLVHVTSQLQRINGQWQRSPTKSSRALEAVNVSQDTVAALREHQRRMAAERTPEWVYYGLVFPSAKGQPLVNQSVLRAWHEACDKAGIERRRFHDLRGSAATLMRDLGVSEDTRMARLGHTTTAMARRYAGASAAQDRAAADALGKALRR